MKVDPNNLLTRARDKEFLVNKVILRKFHPSETPLEGLYVSTQSLNPL